MNIFETRPGMRKVWFNSISVCHDEGAPYAGGGFHDGQDGQFECRGSGGGSYTVIIFEHREGSIGNGGRARVTLRNNDTGKESHYGLKGDHNYVRSSHCPGIYVKHGPREINHGFPLQNPDDPFPGEEPRQLDPQERMF